MKHFLSLLLLFFALQTSVCAETLSGSLKFDWVDMSQAKRNELIQGYKDTVMSLDNELLYSKNDFLDKKKDKDFLLAQALLKEGMEDAQDKTVVGFYKYGLLVAYGVGERTNPKNTFYYNALGKLIYIDVLEKDPEDYPYVAYQFRENGKLAARIYNVSKYDQFMYDSKGEFLGRWYQNKMYDKKGKVSAARSWW